MSNRYILFFKPYDVLSTFTDAEKRQTLGTYVTAPGVYAAGRLDQDSEGLMLLTDDGRLAHLLTDPEHKLPKTYFVQVENEPDRAALAQLRRGVLVKGVMTLPAEVELLDDEPDLPPRSTPIRYRPSIPTRWLRIVLREGRKRQIRHMTAAVGHPTLRLIRVAIGPLTLRGLEPGQWRDLTPEELAALQRALGRPTTSPSIHASRKAPISRPPAPHTGDRSQPRRGGRPNRPPQGNPRTQAAGQPARGPRRGSDAQPGGRPVRPGAEEDTARPARGAGRGPQPPAADERDTPRGRSQSDRRPRGAEHSGPQPQRAERSATSPDTTPRRPAGPSGSRGVGQRPKRPLRRSGGKD